MCHSKLPQLNICTTLEYDTPNGVAISFVQKVVVDLEWLRITGYAIFLNILNYHKMNHIILTILLLLSQIVVFAQPKYIAPPPLPDSVLSEREMKEYANCVRNAFYEKGGMYYRIYGRMRDKGLSHHEAYEGVINLENDTTAFMYTLDAFFRHCGHDGNCLYKQYITIGLTPPSAERFKMYTMHLYKGQKEHNYWDQ